MSLSHSDPELSSESAEHYTPPEVIAAVKHTLGWIDLDPASCPLANKTVGAERIYTREDDGLTRPWFGRVFNNPPGSKRGVASWWHRGARQWREGKVDALLFVIFNLNLLQASQTDALPGDVLPLDGAICIPRKRVCYYKPTADGGVEIEAQPTRPSGFVLLPSREGTAAMLARFGTAFSSFGAVRWDERAISRITTPPAPPKKSGARSKQLDLLGRVA